MIIPNIVEGFLNQITWGGNVLSLTDDGINTTLVVDNALYARQGLNANIGGTDYPIVDADYLANAITVNGVIALATSYTLDPPIFLHGTPMMTNSHFTRAKQIKERMTPLIYLLEIIDREDDGLSSIVEKVSLRMFFLDDARVDWLTDDHYSEVIIPMDNLAELVQSAMYEYPSKFVPDSFTVKKVDHVNFGEYRTLKGHLQSIFDARLSGVERLFRGVEINKPCNS